MTWTHYETETLNTDAGKVWGIWSNVPSWHLWDIDIASSKLADPAAGFVEGAQGSVTMKSGMAADFVLHDVSPHEKFTYSVKVPLAKMDFTFEMKTITQGDAGPPQVQLTHGAVYSGAFGGVYGWFFKDMTVKGLAGAVKNIKSMTEPDNQ
jgi:hypothetical protein